MDAKYQLARTPNIFHGELSLIGAVCHPEGALRIVKSAKGEPNAAQHLGEVVAEKLREGGATGLLATQGVLE